MKLEDQCCSLELAKRLKELGVKQESNFQWLWPNGVPKLQFWRLPPEQREDGKSCAAFTVAELGEMLPEGYNSGKMDSEYRCFHRIKNEDFYANTEADCRAKMLIHLIEKGIVKP